MRDGHAPLTSAAMSTSATAQQPLALVGVEVHDLERRHDHRGWECVQRGTDTAAPSQTLVVWSRRGVLRGAYVHPGTTSQLSLVEGAAVLGLHDLRPASATYGRSVTIELGERHAQSSVRIPAGVAYALWFTTDAVHALASAGTFDLVDEYTCRWDDPGLGFRWHPVDPVLSTRDALAGSLNALRTSVAAALR